MSTMLGSLRQIDAGVLSVGYAETGPTGGPAVLLLHGWPYDIHSYVDVTPLLAGEGYPRDRPVRPRLRHDTVLSQQRGPQRATLGHGSRRRRSDGVLGRTVISSVDPVETDERASSNACLPRRHAGPSRAQ